ncbi:MAG: response regulator, partial [Candidatus Aminicenantes bacterium]
MPQYLDLDKVRLKQVLINLVSNAVKYTQKGYIKLTAGVKENGIDNSKFDLVISVEDTGIGIPEENQQKIFEPYERRETKYGEIQEGSGLGLAISRGIIELMGGEISVDSEPGSGSTFTILIRNVNVSQDVNKINDEDDFDYSSIVFERQKLLIVDNNKEIRRIVKGYLEGSRIKVLEAEDGKKAVQMAKEHKPDLILMDLKMPVMNGIEATRQIREEGELKAVPIFAFTASKTDPDDVAKYQDLFESYIFKPISKAKLFFELTKFLKHKRAGEENVEEPEPLFE